MSEPLPVDIDLDKLCARMNNDLDILFAMITVLDQRSDALESQLGQTHELLTILQDASRPAATILFNLAQLPALDDRIKETIQQTLAPLDAALASMTKARGE